MIKLGFVLLIAVILVQGMLFWKYQRQVKDICRQLSFLMKHDSNMLITREMDFGGIGRNPCGRNHSAYAPASCSGSIPILRKHTTSP